MCVMMTEIWTIDSVQKDTLLERANIKKSYPPASEASWEVANLTERKIHIPPYMVSKNLFVCLSVCYQIWPQLSHDWQNWISWNIF